MLCGAVCVSTGRVKANPCIQVVDQMEEELRSYRNFFPQTSLRKLCLLLRQALSLLLGTMSLLQTAGVFPAGSACPRAPGSTLEPASSWKWQAWSAALWAWLPAPTLCRCIGGASVTSCFRGAPANKKSTTPCQGSLHAPIIDGCCQWWVSVQLQGQPGRNCHKYSEEQAGFILIGVNRAPNSKTYLWDRREGRRSLAV